MREEGLKIVDYAIDVQFRHPWSRLILMSVLTQKDRQHMTQMINDRRKQSIFRTI